MTIQKIGKGPTGGINGIVSTTDKTFSINFSKAKTKLCLSFHCNSDESYLYVNKTETFEFKVKNSISWYSFCLGSISKEFTKAEKTEISLSDIVYDFSVDHGSKSKKTFLIFTNI